MKLYHSVRLIAALSVGGAAALHSSAEEQRRQAPGTSRTTSVAEESKIDLNTADVKALEAVPVIGPEIARKIVAARPFATVDDLDHIKGISAEQLEQIRAKVTVSTSHVPRKLGIPAAAAEAGTAVRETRKKVDLNTADLKTLEAIPSIGPESARAIVAARPFANIDELNRVKGITAEQLELIRADVTVATPERATKKSHPTR
jgi:DNA uptake protein ComE-like DNA-binding protein